MAKIQKIPKAQKIKQAKLLRSVGKTNQEIADIMELDIKTVNKYFAHRNVNNDPAVRHDYLAEKHVNINT